MISPDCAVLQLLGHCSFLYEYDEELYEEEGVVLACDLDPVTFCGECAPEDGEFLPLPNSPREGVHCYDNVHTQPSGPGWSR